MKDLRENLYDRFKDRRYATLFLLSMAVGSALMLVAVRILRSTSDDSKRVALPVIAACFGLWTLVSVRRAFFHQPERSDFPKLSSDERRVARSKLKNEMKKRFGHTTPRAPDVDLKY